MATSGNSIRTAVDLDNLIKEYTYFEKVMRHTAQENSCLEKEVRSLNKQLQSSQEAEKLSIEEAGKFKAMVDNLQRILLQRCDKEEENAELKSHLTAVTEKTARLEQEHKTELSEALKNHKQEIQRVRQEELQQNRKVITTLEKSLQGKESQIQQLEKQLADMSHLHQTEIVKLRLEFDEKILKLQRERNNAKAQAGQSFNANTDIFRKKLQFAKAEAQKEINSLKSQVAELERKLTMRQMPASKRKLF
ncbi:coiled-coil domain-containing protein 152-like [Pocillopora damicornis]|uniref:coiled-coil domain-containing protein 152-like n=1 Tax=Pocillopora damicornis TaxID=46731 RepID=UPI000F54D4AB|nr:coiled-coil domain-containing protein 152-like [Pocillopora damicornis]